MVLHAIQGRVRLSVAQLKRAPEKALQLQQQLEACEGIVRAVANPAPPQPALSSPFRIT